VTSATVVGVQVGKAKEQISEPSWVGRRLRGFGWRFKVARRLCGRDAGGRLAEFLAPPPPPPIEPRAEGRLDEPRQGAIFERGVLTVAGWAIFPSGPTARVEIWLGERSLGLAQLGIARPDVRAQSDHADAALAGFSLACDLSAWPGPDGEVAVRAVPTSVSGERLHLPPSKITVTPAPSPAPTPITRSPRGARSRGQRILVCTHQLCLGGASRYLLETLEALLGLRAIDPVVLSPIGGPLRARLEALDVPVHVSGPAPLDDLQAHDGRVEEILAWAAPQGFETALVNTASPLTAAGAEVAGRLGIPALWAIHESFEPGVLWAGCNPEVRGRVEETLRGAELAIFEAKATANIFEPYLPGRCLTLPYGLALAPIDDVREDFDRASARQRLGVPLDSDLILCVGTIDPRKAQGVLAQAFNRIAGRHPRALLALVGTDDTPDTLALADWIASSGSAERIKLISTTPEIQQWYGVSDLLVCASRIESLPRAVLEGMAWELPILATKIFGLPELIDDGTTGWLCEPGDTAALAAALDRALNSGPEERRRIGRAGRELVERRHEMGAYATAVVELIERAARDKGVSDRRASAGGPGLAAAPDSRPG
jgi:D-inositol-3-phosphate glycosyltransferase